MIETANKQLQYMFPYHQKIIDLSQPRGYLSKATLDFNHRPHGVLNELTPVEILKEKPAIKIPTIIYYPSQYKGGSLKINN